MVNEMDEIRGIYKGNQEDGEKDVSTCEPATKKESDFKKLELKVDTVLSSTSMVLGDIEKTLELLVGPIPKEEPKVAKIQTPENRINALYDDLERIERIILETSRVNGQIKELFEQKNFFRGLRWIR